MSDLGDRIVEQARTYVGTKWRHLGRDRGGIDCVGLVTCVAYDIGICNYIPRTYTRNTKPSEMIEQFRKFCDLVPLSEIAPGDVSLFYTGVRGHCGIYCGKTIIHAYHDKGMVVEGNWNNFLDQRISRMKLSGVFRFRE